MAVMREHIIELAVLAALTPGGLTAEDCAKLTAEESKEVARRLVEESRRLLGGRR